MFVKQNEVYDEELVSSDEDHSENYDYANPIPLQKVYTTQKEVIYPCI